MKSLDKNDEIEIAFEEIIAYFFSIKNERVHPTIAATKKTIVNDNIIEECPLSSIVRTSISAKAPLAPLIAPINPGDNLLSIIIL